MRARIITALALTAALGTTAAFALMSGDDDPGAVDQPADPAAGACLAGDPECNDIPGVADGEPAPGMNMCLPDVPDCEDVVVEEQPPSEPGSEPDGGDATDQDGSDADRDRARAQLGLAQDDLDEDVRIGRRGEEQYMLTEDYVLGRLTVELDDDGTGTFRVTSVTVELADGPETFTA